MSDTQDLPVAPVSPVGDTAPVTPVRPEPRPTAPPEIRRSAPAKQDVAAATRGSLSPSYAQFIINPDTHDVVIRIRDAATNQVINEYPSREVEDMAKYMKQYAEAAARRRTAQRGSAGN